MFENMTPYLFYKLFLLILLIFVLNWAVGKSAEKDKIVRIIFVLIGAFSY